MSLRRPDLRVLSLGAGVQSSTLALMSAAGELDKVDCAIFADTQWEPASTYAYLDWLASVLTFPLKRVTAGSLREHIIESTGGGPFRGPPFFTRGADGSVGILRRQCTREFKITPIHQEIRRMLGLEKGQRAAGRYLVELWTGISTDEASRMKPAQERWIEKRYPLIERGMSRLDCQLWMDKHGYPRPAKSACIGCTYHDDRYWQRMRDERPEEWRDACAVDAAIRRGVKGTKSEAIYLHRSCTPLAQAELKPDLQRGLWDEECEGMCGL